MKVFIISGNPGKYYQDKGVSEKVSGSWIASLQHYINQERPDVKIGLYFEGSGNYRKECINNTTYYVAPGEGGLVRLINSICPQKRDREYLEYIKASIEDFNPDIIEVFGSEKMFGLIYQCTDKPIILHIQGLLAPCYNAWYPPTYNIKKTIWMNRGSHFGGLIEPRILKHAVKREREILQNIHYFFGRTDWDERVASFFSPNMKYFYCSEMLRPVFTESKDFWQYDGEREITITTVLNSATYKGSDVILKTAKLLKEKNVKFTWNVCGTNQMKNAEYFTKINHKDVNVNLLGRVDAPRIKELILSSTSFVHLSYIDNSPNSVCEAQVLGVPVIAANVGGVSSIIGHMESGILVPANDIYLTASYIIELSRNAELCTRLGQNARKVAKERHNPSKIIRDLINAFENIINDRS